MYATNPLLNTQGIRYLAALFSLAAGLIHALLAPEHFEEWWGYGLFFLVSAVAQIGYTLMLLPQSQRTMGVIGLRPDEARSLRLFYWLGILGNTAIVLMWVITRTLGVPLFGPNAGEVEEVTLIGLASVILELLLIACLFVLLRRLEQETLDNHASGSI